MKLIGLSQGQFAKIDDDEYSRVSAFKWCAAKHPWTGFYAVRNTPRDENGKQKRIYLHRFIMGEPVGMKVDHENHDGLDCQKSNLRICTSSQNAMNRVGADKSSKSGIRGVMWFEPKKKWRAKIRLDGKGIHLGYFPTKELAAVAYATANKKYFGEFGGKF